MNVNFQEHLRTTGCMVASPVHIAHGMHGIFRSATLLAPSDSRVGFTRPTGRLLISFNEWGVGDGTSMTTSTELGPAGGTFGARTASKLDRQEEHYWIPTGGQGLQIFVRLLPALPQGNKTRRPVLYVHGATVPSGLSIAHRFGGYAWRDAL